MGGTELHTQEVARRQAADGHEVHILCPSAQNETDVKVEIEQGVTVHRVSSGARGRTLVFFNSFHFPKLVEAFETLLASADLVHVQHLMGVPLALVEKCIAANIPYIITLHDYWFPCANAQLYTNYDQSICAGPDAQYHNCGRCALARIGLDRAKPLAYAVAPIMRYRQKRLKTIFAGAAKIIAPTQFVHDIYQQNGYTSRKLFVLRHGIDVPQSLIDTAKQTAERLAQFHVVFVGSIAQQKGVHVLVEALRQLPSVRLTIAGGLDSFPEYVAGLKDISAESPNIHFAGRIPHNAVWSLLASADAVVLPTLWYEVSPLTIDEFFAAGVPIIASDIGAMSEKIRHGVDGLLVRPNAPTELKTAIESLMHNPDLLEQMRQNISPVRTIETYVAELEAVYQDVLS
ncbi:MAG: glycosyltransferase [Candidatus Promineifilaceae bacterium]